MSEGRAQHKIQAVASELARSLVQRDRQASIHLARLLLVDKAVDDSAYRLFACALARQLRRWPTSVQMIDQSDVVRLLRAAAYELLEDRWESDRETHEEGRC